MKAGLARRAGAVVAGLAVVSIAVTLLALAARWWWVAELFTHFRLQLLAAQLVLLAGLLAARYRRVALGVAVSAAVNWWYLQPVVWPDSRVLAAAEGELRLMAVNVFRRNDDHEGLLAMIAEERPDLILVVELTEEWSRRLESLDSDYAYHMRMPDDSPFGLALLSRYPLEVLSTGRLGATAAIDARVEGPNGAFRVLGVHLMPPMSAPLAAERNRQLAELAQRRARIEEPLVVLGDLNVSPYSPYYSDLLAATALQDTLAGRGPSATWPSFVPVLGIPIDHCLVSAHFTVLERRHLSAFGSDHYPVLVRLLLGTSP